VFTAASSSRTVDTALRLTAIILLLRPMGPWYVLPVILGLAALALISPAVLRAPATWMAQAFLIALRIAEDWPLADNHIYLLAYWCLAAALALGTNEVSEVLATSSRRLVGLAFALAALWKGLLSEDYLDGRFFRVTIQTDPRFADVARLVGGLSSEQLEQNRVALQALPGGAELLHPLQLTEPWRLQLFATGATWGVLGLEILVATAFLTRAASQPNWLKHGLLLLFCFVTYAFAPVAGFGWMLLVLGLAQCDEADRALRTTYVAAFLLVLVYAEVPWAGLLGDWFGAG
jgi:hypothetical protein